MEKRMMTEELFKAIYTKDIADRTESIKGSSFSLTYMSWAEAWKQAKEVDAECIFEVLEGEDGFPLFSRGDMHFVKTKVTFMGVTQQCHLPVMDNKHNAVTKPNARHVNDSIQRCLAKNLALFGIGLALYNGEDLEQFRVKSDEDKMKESIIADLKARISEDKEAKGIYAGYGKEIGKKLTEMNLGELQELAGKIRL